LEDGTQLIVHELSFLRPFRSVDDPGTVMRLYDVMHITEHGLMERWGSCTPSELTYQLARFGIEGISEIWDMLE
jgi:hypothetical protein